VKKKSPGGLPGLFLSVDLNVLEAANAAADGMTGNRPPGHWLRLWGAVCGATFLFFVAGAVGAVVSGPDGFWAGALCGGLLGFAGGYACPHASTAIVEFILLLFP